MELLQTHQVDCPYCGETIHVMIDTSVAEQNYIEDCQVCCRPIIFNIMVENNQVNLNVQHENE